MSKSNAPSADLLRNRSKTLARTLYRQLSSEGFTHEQMVALIGDLLENVTDAMKAQPAAGDLARA